MDFTNLNFITNAYLHFAINVTLLLVLIKVALKFLISQLKKLSKTTKTQFDDIAISSIEAISNFKLVLLSFLIPSLSLNLAPSTFLLIKSVITILIATIINKGSIILVDKVASSYLKKNPSTKTIVAALKKLTSVIIYLVSIMIILDLYGVNINTLIAGLGIGGVAAALAVQNILADVFSAVTLYIDRPFNVGDYISFGSNRGTITKIGLKSTSLKTILGTEIIVSNKDLTSGQIENFGRMKDRTLNFDLGVAYNTPVEKLDLVPEIVKNAVESNGAELVHCYLTELRDFTLNFIVRYKINSKEYKEYLICNEKILKAILLEFKKHEIEIPFPTQNILHKHL